MSARDDIAGGYSASAVLERTATALFWGAIVLSAVDAATSSPVVSLLSALAFSFYVVAGVVDDSFFWYPAESERRANAIESAYGVDLTGKTAEGYYNNRAGDGDVRYLLNVYESAFFSMSISKKMIPLRTVLCIGVLALLAAVLFCGFSGYFAIAAQAVFSAYFVIGGVNLAVYHFRVKKVCDKFYAAFVTRKFDGSSESAIPLFANALEYEAIKAHYKIRLSSRIYKRDDPALSEQWEELESKMDQSLFG